MHYAFSRIRYVAFWMDDYRVFLIMIPLGLANVSENTMEVISQITVFLYFRYFGYT